MSDDTQAAIARSMAWERAKGELNSIRHTFLSGRSPLGQFEAFSDTLDGFIEEVEAGGLHE